MPVELLGPVIFILMSVVFFWVSKMTGHSVAMTLALGRLAFSKQISMRFQASRLTWKFATSLLLTAFLTSVLICGGWRMFYISLNLGDAVVVTSVAIVLSVCSLYFVRGFSSFKGYES